MGVCGGGVGSKEKRDEDLLGEEELTLTVRGKLGESKYERQVETEIELERQK